MAAKKNSKKAAKKKTSASSKAPTIQLLNSDGSLGGRLAEDKYVAARDILLAVIPGTDDGIAFGDLASLLEDRIDPAFLPASGSGAWLATTVKLDLEGRGDIERVPDNKPQRVRRVR